MNFNNILDDLGSADPSVRSKAAEAVADVAQCDYAELVWALSTRMAYPFPSEYDDVPAIGDVFAEVCSTLKDAVAEGSPQSLVDLALSEAVAAMCLAGLALKHDNEVNDSEWGPASAAVELLTELLQRDESNAALINKLASFVGNSHRSDQWKERDASLLAAAVLCEVSDTFSGEFAPLMLFALDDPHPVVQDSALWGLSKVVQSPLKFESLILIVLARVTEVMRVHPQLLSRGLLVVNNFATACLEQFGKEGETAAVTLPGELLGALLSICLNALQPSPPTEAAAKGQDKRVVCETMASVVELVGNALPPQVSQSVLELLQGAGSTDPVDVELVASLSSVIYALAHVSNHVSANAEAILSIIVATICTRNGSPGAVENMLLTVQALYNTSAESGRPISAKSNSTILGVVIELLFSPSESLVVVAAGCISDMARAIGSEFDAATVMPAVLRRMSVPCDDSHLKLGLFSCAADILLYCPPAATFAEEVKTIFNETDAADDDEELADIIGAVNDLFPNP